MSLTESPTSPLETPATQTSGTSNGALKSGFPKLFAIFLVAALALSMLASAYLWRKVTKMQEHLAQQSADATTISIEARAVAKSAQDVAREAAAKAALTETKVAEVALQRGQLDELMQSLSRSRDENLVVDIESALRLAQQQAQLTGSMEPLLVALKTADTRLARSAQPRLNAVRRALISDTDRVKATVVADIPALLIKLDELTQGVDNLPMNNAVPLPAQINAAVNAAANTAPNAKVTTAKATAAAGGTATNGAGWLNWQNMGSDAWQTAWLAVRTELLKLVRVSRIDNPDAVLLTPEQSYFWRENLKLKLLNARLSLLSRHVASTKADLTAAKADIRKYANPNTGAAQRMLVLLEQVESQVNTVTIPSLDDTLAALSVAALTSSSAATTSAATSNAAAAAAAPAKAGR